jgi:hypothetical protein
MAGCPAKLFNQIYDGISITVDKYFFYNLMMSGGYSL